MADAPGLSTEKSNEVARNSIWREHVKKEDSLYREPSPFRVDAKRVKPLPAKPNQMDPRTVHQMDVDGDGEVNATEQMKYDQIMKTIEGIGSKSKHE